MTTPPQPKGRIGFYGCAANGTARLVRVATPEGEKPVSTAQVQCPVCGLEHPVSIMWRPPVKADEGREPELLVGRAS